MNVSPVPDNGIAARIFDTISGKYHKCMLSLSCTDRTATSDSIYELG